MNFGRDGDALDFFDVFKARQCGSVADDADNFVDSDVEFSAVNVLVERVCMVIAGGKINGGDAKFRRDERYVGKRALGSLETFAGDIRFIVSQGSRAKRVGSSEACLNDF